MIMKTLHTIYTNFAKRNLARFLTVFTILFTIGIGQILGATASYTWDLTSSSANWTSSNCEVYFSQPYGMKKEDAYIINKNIDEFKQYAATATSIQIGVKSLCNGATTSKLTIYLVDKDGNTVGSGMEITPDNKSNASNTTYKYVTFTSNLSTATGYKIQCTTFGKNVLVNGSSYEITYDDSSSGSGNTGGGNDSDGCTWELVTDASTLAAGDRIVIAAAGYDYAMGDNSSNGEYRIRTAITKNENKIAITNDVQIIILEEGTKTNTFAFNVDDSYLYASSSSSNQLKTKSTLDNNGSWSITIANGDVATIKAQGDKTRNWIRYNANSTQERFSCYGSGQSDVVIYKEICAKEVTITLNPDGGTGTFADWITSGDNYTMIVDAGTEITLPTLQKIGYNFAGWHDGTATVTSPYTTTKDITLTAQWTANKHSLTWNLNGGIVTTAGTNAAVNSTGTASGSVAYGTAIKAPVVIKTGYTFAGWHDGNSIVTPPNTMPDNNISYKAQWAPNTYTVRFDANEGTGEMENQSFTYDAEPTSLSANIFERVGYNFNGWNTAEDGSGTSYADKEEVKNLTFEANGVVTLYAQWTAKDIINYRTLCTYNIEYTNLEGTTHSNPVTYTAANLPLTFTAPSAREGYTFAGWSPASLDENTRGDQVVEAQWAAIHTVTWMVNGSLAEGDPTTSVVNGQTITTLPTTPDVDCNGKVFVGWTTAEINGETATIPDPLYTELGYFPAVTSNMTFYAVFANGTGEEQWIETAIGDIEATDEVVIAMQTSDKTYAMYINDDATATPDAIVVEPSDLTSASGIATGLIWFIEKDGNGKLIIHPKKDIEKNLYCNPSADNNRVRVGKSHDNHELYKTFEIDGNYLKNSVTQHYIGVNFTYNLWYGYADNSKFPNQTLKFYKKTTVYTSYTNYSTLCMAGVCDITNANPIYVTSAVGQKIKATDKLVLTTTDMAVGTEISLSAPNITFYKEGVEITQLTTTAASETFELEIAYQPTISNTTEQPTITLEILGYQFTFNNKISCRSLPENFVIATKVGATWYALPANMNGATNPEGVVIDVDETTMTATAPNTTVYTLFPVATVNGNSDRYKKYGERLRFAAVNNGNRGLWANDAKSGTTINNDAAITAANSTAGAAYEWKITTTIVDGNWQYTLQTDQSTNKKLRYWTAASGGAKWGTYAYGNDKLYFLPVTETKPFDYKVVEWYPTKVLIQTDAAITNPIVKIGGILVDHVTCMNKGGKLYEISGLPLVNNPTKILTLSYTADEVTYTNSKVVPIILSRETKSISGEPFVALTKEVYNYADLVVRDGAILTMDGTQEANTLWDVTIYPTSKIYVPESQKLTVHSLTFFGGIDEIYNGSTSYTLNKYGVPELSLKGSLKKSISTIDYLMRVNLDQMYSLTVPYDVQLADIKYWDGSDIALGSALYVSAYDGEARANQSKKTWIYETDFNPATLKAGVGYTISAELQAGVGNEYSILRMPMMSNVASGDTEDAKTVAVTAWGIDANITDNHKGWNLVGNPYMTTIKGADDDDLVLGYLKETGTGPWQWVNDDIRYVTIPSDDGTYYWQQKFTTAELPPFKNFFVQIGTTGDLQFGLGTRQSMPARSTQAAIEKEVEFEILMSNDARQDNTGLLISEEYSPAYEINADLEKMIGSMSVYTIYGGYKLAYNALSPINASEWIPMGYIAPAAGEYTFRLDDVEKIVEQVEHVYVIDYDANNIVDLMTDEYKFTTDKEQNDNRFAINVVLIQDKDNTTTGLDIINGNNTAPIKFIYHDKIYIKSGEVIYDGTGKQVTNINK